VHLDAHLDTSEDNFGQRFAHGSVFWHAITEGLVEPRRMIQLGIRAPAWPEMFDWTRGQGVTILPAQEVHESTPAAIAAQVRDVVGRGPAYLSCDIDCLDPAFAPGTGTPVPGGLTAREALALLRALAGVRLAGMDLVEVCPPLDHADVTSHLAAHLVFEGLALAALARGDAARPAHASP
jgi:agmatinase